MSGAVFPLQDNQLEAADPQHNVWLSASAGTGKTQVLSARVLRLLLEPDVEPSQILCLTFTKAGAAEMANRINAVLARWVRLDVGALGKELGYLGADFDPATQDRARTLFASVLDCPGGGLRIDTIHAFSQWLLAKFPEESGLQPGSRPMEDRERELLAREVLSDMLTEAEARGDTALIEAVSDFTRVKDPDALRGWLMRCASAQELWEGPRAWQSPMRERVLRLLDMPAGADEDWAEEVLHPDTFPDAELRMLANALREWGKVSGEPAIAGIEQWLALEPDARAGEETLLLGGILNKEGAPNGNLRHAAKFDPDFVAHQRAVAEVIAQYQDRRALLELAEFLTPALEIGRAFAMRWAEAKAREGLLDFDDLIRKAAALLGRSEAAAWIRYKLDRSFDHVLIDEAQDTNGAQWNIIDALIDDFFSGAGARGDRQRTIFTVGDYKQAIFRFQGTSPENFERAKVRVRQRIEDARAHAHELRENRRVPSWNDLDLGRSYRTSLPVLGFVNTAIRTLGYEAFGLPKEPEQHVGADRAGLVTLWPPVAASSEQDDDEDDDRGDQDRDDDTGEEQGWLPASDTLLAENIAEQVRCWVSDEEPFVLEKGKRRHARAGDVMVLVRRRKDLAAQIVARLYAKGVPVAGVDRLRLGQPLAVRDIMVAVKFAAQPLDDLSLANLLGSPLIGWTQDDLLEHVPRAKDTPLWHHLRDNDVPFVQAAVEKLREVLARADFETPQALIAWLLSGPWAARRKVVARLGSEANDPLDELVNAAFAYESAHVPSLAGFIAWFEAGTGELKRDADAASGQVRVMTVHGSKGLQAPIVILADATGEPGKGGDLDLPDDPLDLAKGDADMEFRKVPLPKLSKGQLAGPAVEAAEAARIAEMQEHWRLLYVAMTRAEEALFIGGSLNKTQAKKGEAHPDSWYAHLAPLFDTPPLEDRVWGVRHEWGMRADPVVGAEDAAAPSADLPVLPVWARTPIGPEPRPPRPLAPSSAGEEQGADPPLPPEAAGIAARRGTLIHRLLERLPDIAPDDRRTVAEAWLARQAGDLDADTHAEMLGSALAVLAEPGFAAIFSSQALAEVPLAAVVDGVVVAGTADRLLITEDAVTVVDFKTTRRPPETLGAVPAATLRQMAAYRAALAVIYPGRAVQAALLYTHAPRLIALPGALLDTHKQALGAAQDNYAPLPLE